MTQRPTTPDRTLLETLHLPATVRADVFIRACTGLIGALFLFGCATPRPAADNARQAPPVQTEIRDNKAAETDAGTTVTPDSTPLDANSIYFQLRSTLVDEAGKQKLREHAERLKQNPRSRITLIGHMDDLGSRNYNLAITEERLTAVINQLHAFGVPARQIRRDQTASESSSTPCNTEACRAQMRRVELQYSE